MSFCSRTRFRRTPRSARISHLHTSNLACRTPIFVYIAPPPHTSRAGPRMSCPSSTNSSCSASQNGARRVRKRAARYLSRRGRAACPSISLGYYAHRHTIRGREYSRSRRRVRSRTSSHARSRCCSRVQSRSLATNPIEPRSSAPAARRPRRMTRASDVRSGDENRAV